MPEGHEAHEGHEGDEGHWGHEGDEGHEVQGHEGSQQVIGLYHRPYRFCQLVPWNGYTTAIGWQASAMYGQHHCQTLALQPVCAKNMLSWGELGWAGVKAIMASHVFWHPNHDVGLFYHCLFYN